MYIKFFEQCPAMVNQIEKPKQLDRQKVLKIKTVYLKYKEELEKLLNFKKRIIHKIKKQKCYNIIMSNLMKMSNKEIEKNKVLISDFLDRYDTLSMQELLIFLRVLNKN